jgi:hypothetical protein
MANTGQQNFAGQTFNPFDPASVIEQQALARRQALIDQLRSREMAAIPQDPRGRYSPLAAALPGIQQGLNNFIAGRLQKGVDKKAAELTTARQQALMGAFGMGGQRAPVAAAPAASVPSAPPAVPAPSGNTPAMSAAPASMPPAMGTGGAPMTPIPQQAAATAAPAPQAPMPAAAPAQPLERGPLQLSDNPMADYSRYLINPDKYTETVIAASAPTDFAKQLQQAGIEPGTPLFNQAMQAQVAKQNYVAPINGRPGSTIRDPFNPSQIVGYDAPSVEGALPVYGPNGMPTGYTPAPGYTQAVSAAEAAKAGGKAVGAAPFELVQVYDPATGQMKSIPKSDALGTPGGVTTTAPLGQPAAYQEAGKNSANQFNAVVQAGQEAQNLGYVLGQIGTLAKSIPGTGAGFEAVNQWKSRINTAVQAAGGQPWFDNKGIANAQEIQKYVAQIAQLQASQLGGSNGSTDAKLGAAFASLADVNKAPEAIKGIVAYGQGVQLALLGKSQAAAQWQQARGPETYAQFSQKFQSAYDPRVYQWMAQGPDVVATEMKKLSPPERERLKAKYLDLKSLGALPQ